MPALTFWALNTLAGWDPEPLVEALERPAFGVKNEVALGNRAPFNRASDGSTRHALSHEDGDPLFNEYFVPIAVKCLGNPKRFLDRFGKNMTARGLETFEAIRTYYRFYFERSEPMWRGYWDATGDGMAMFTREPGLGLYEVMATHEGGPAVLAGYSQGGLVARYLAWLDEKLMSPAHRRVCAVVTVQSPNRGSPFANRYNEASVARGLLGILAGISGFPIVPTSASPAMHGALTDLTERMLGRSHFSADTIAALLDAARIDASTQKPGLPRTLTDAMVTRVPKRGEGERFRLVVTLRKWLSGLAPLHQFPTAFADLNPMDLDRPASVLGGLAAHPLEETWTAAVVGTDNRLATLASDGRPWWLKMAIRAACAGKNARRVLERAEAAYSGSALIDCAPDPADPHPLQARMQQDYVAGIPIETQGGDTARIPPLAHDFIIPSASQAIFPAPSGRGFLGNLINRGGTHLGGSLADGDESDQPLVVQHLRRIGREVSVRLRP